MYFFVLESKIRAPAVSVGVKV